jgi:hypothetical protein
MAEIQGINYETCQFFFVKVRKVYYLEGSVCITDSSKECAQEKCSPK